MIQFDAKRLLVVAVLAGWIAFTAWGVPWLDGRDASSYTRASVSHFLGEWVDAAYCTSRPVVKIAADSWNDIVDWYEALASVMQALLQCLLRLMAGDATVASMIAWLFVPFAFGVLWVSIAGAWVYFDYAAAAAR
jgi:hypothetical protein